jgi:uncharacterized protein (DUF1015 family)
VHRHQFQVGERFLERTGLLARVRLSDWEERAVLPHERTTPGPKRERTERLRAVNANLSPLYFLYRDPDREIRDLLAPQAPAAKERERDRMGGAHQLSEVTDTELHRVLRAAFARRTVFVADGHHRYEAALAYRDECRQRHGHDRDAPWEFVLTLLSAVEDPGVRVLPTHRVVRGSTVQVKALRELLERWFDVLPAAAPEQSRDSDLMFRVALEGASRPWSVYARPGSPHLALLPTTRSRAWRSLDVSVLSGVLDSLRGVASADDTSWVRPVVDENEAVRQVAAGEAAAAFLLPTPSLDRLLAVAEAGDLLPPKSTWFEPKAPAGLVINDLSE